MIARAALVLKDTIASRFASIQAILGSVKFLENDGAILAKCSSRFYCVHVLYYGTDSLM